jgi:hypothetical protein
MIASAYNYRARHLLIGEKALPGHALSCERQERDLRAFAERGGFEIVAVIDWPSRHDSRGLRAVPIKPPRPRGS